MSSGEEGKRWKETPCVSQTKVQLWKSAVVLDCMKNYQPILATLHHQHSSNLPEEQLILQQTRSTIQHLQPSWSYHKWLRTLNVSSSSSHSSYFSTARLQKSIFLYVVRKRDVNISHLANTSSRLCQVCPRSVHRIVYWEDHCVSPVRN